MFHVEPVVHQHSMLVRFIGAMLLIVITLRLVHAHLLRRPPVMIVANRLVVEAFGVEIDQRLTRVLLTVLNVRAGQKVLHLLRAHGCEVTLPEAEQHADVRRTLAFALLLELVHQVEHVSVAIRIVRC